MGISAVTGVAAAFEGSRVAGQQQAASTASASQTKRDNDRQAEDVDLKKTDTVTQDQETSQTSETSGHRVDILA
jgi:hypothetical protein